MKVTSVFALIAGALAYVAAAYGLDRTLTGRVRAVFRHVAVLAGAGLFLYSLRRLIDDSARAVDVAKFTIALVAALLVFYEGHRVGMRRPISERWKKFAGVALGLAAIAAYFNGVTFGYPKFYHRHDQFHYYLGAKYFREMGYDGLYKCVAIAQDELGVVTWQNAAGRTMRLDMSKEVRHPDWKIRNLGGDNLLMPAIDVLDRPEECKKGFAPDKWAAFKEDVKFLRLASDKGYWEGMQRDHGYNPPPVWTIMGWVFASMFPAGAEFDWPIIGKFVWLQALAMIDVIYLAIAFAAIGWAFGWRVFAVAAIVWGCQSPAPFYWTGGAFLRQDWLLFFVLSACFARKRYYALAGASMVYAGLLRVFPGLVVIGWLTVAAAYLVKHKTLAPAHRRVLLGGVLAAAVLIPASLAVSGKDAYQQFYRHTIVVHDQTPLTNHMGLRVLIAHEIGTGVESGRMKYTKDTKLVDPFEVWKRMRNERYHKYRFVAYGIIALSLAAFVWVVRRIKSLWIAQCLGQVWIILLSQLTCYYYAFLILTAPLTKVKRQLEIPLFGFAALSQVVWMSFYWNDDKYTALTAISLVLCYGLLCAFAPKQLPWKQAESSDAGTGGPAPAPLS